LTPLTKPCIGKELPWMSPADCLFIGQFLGNLLRSSGARRRRGTGALVISMCLSFRTLRSFHRRLTTSCSWEDSYVATPLDHRKELQFLGRQKLGQQTQKIGKTESAPGALRWRRVLAVSRARLAAACDLPAAVLLDQLRDIMILVTTALESDL